MGTRFAPKPTVLQGEPTPTQLEAWINNMIFNLTVDGSFEEFLAEGFTWSPSTVVNRGLIDDENGPAQSRRTARQKVAYLNLMLGSIHSYAPVISKRFITEEAQSLNEIWDRLRTRFGCRKTGGLILDLASISLEPEESYEGLWERVLSFVEGNLLLVSDKIQHMGSDILRSEEMTPTLYNISIVLWLRIIHPNLPALIRQKYATELRNKTLASIRDEISESLSSLLMELTGEEAAISRSYRSRYQNKTKQNTSTRGNNRSCPICKASGRPDDHYLSHCPFLPESERKYMKLRARAVDATECEEEQDLEISSNRRVDIEASPEIRILCGSEAVRAVLDSGAESNLISRRCAARLGAEIKKTNAKASQADGKTRLSVVGEVHLEFERYPHCFKFNGLVVDDLKDDVIAGIPFLTLNDIYVRPAKKTIHIGDKEIIKYESLQSSYSTNRNVNVIIRVPSQTSLLPGEVLRLPLPTELHNIDEVAVEPRIMTPSMKNEKLSSIWLKPTIAHPVDNNIELSNTSDSPVHLKKHEQIAHVRMIMSPESDPKITPESTNIRKVTLNESIAHENITIDENQISPEMKRQFKDVHTKFKKVFDDRSIGLYNGKSGPLEVKVNMGPSLPKQRKGRMPLYNRKLQEEYQEICDSLEGSVLIKPEDAGITVEYLNPSFLVHKPSGKKRLVTAFGEVGQYAKPQPALMPDTNQVLRAVGNWKYLIKTDLSSAYWQIPLSKDSMKFCGIVTPFKGVRVYTRGAMGMPGTETALEELLSRVLGELIAAGGVIKIADDLMLGSDTPQNLLKVWSDVLEALQENGLRLSATKTFCCPSTVMMLGWIWREGTLQASPHKISALESVTPPTTVGKLRSYIGSYKYLSKVIPSYSRILAPLEEVVGGRQSAEKILWTDSLLEAFKKSQGQLSNAKIITIPRREDSLQIVTDASKVGLAATLYVIRNNKPYISGFYNAKLKEHQVNWIPCEIEALCIGAAVNHFGPEIINSNNQTIVFTDSRPCVLSYEKLCRGEFSSSARVATFLSMVSRYHVKLKHIKGIENGLVDYASRNPSVCSELNCQICKFVDDMDSSVVRQCSVKDVLESKASVPFSTRNSWHEIQQSCKDLRRATAHLKQGTCPSKKETNIRDVKRYLNIIKIAKDGLLVVHQQDPLRSKQEKIVVPREYLHGLLVSLHLRLSHPTKLQLKKVFSRAFFALDADKALTEVNLKCHVCTSLQNMPTTFLEQSTSLPAFIGSNFGADILKRCGQLILILRENISAYTVGKFVANEKADTLKEGLLILTSQIRSKVGPPIRVRVDPASGWRSEFLKSSGMLSKDGIELEIGFEKNKNKNPIADTAIKELHAEIVRIDSSGGAITEVTLAKALSTLNDRIRNGALSAREVWTKRDQFTGNQLPINDERLINNKYESRQKSHKSSANYQARGKVGKKTSTETGDLVYLKSDRDKTKPRDRYIVVQPNKEARKNTLTLQKFVGSQLRSRKYVVNPGDIIKIPEHKFNFDFTNEDSIDIDESSDIVENDPVKEKVLAPALDDDFNEEEIQLENNPEELQPRRSARHRRPPSRYGEPVTE